MTEWQDIATAPIWTRFRNESDPDWRSNVPWPESQRDKRDLIVWNPCDGYHFWSRDFGECPPGTHFTPPPPPPQEPAK